MIASKEFFANAAKEMEDLEKDRPSNGINSPPGKHPTIESLGYKSHIKTSTINNNIAQHGYSTSAGTIQLEKLNLEDSANLRSTNVIPGTTPPMATSSNMLLNHFHHLNDSIGSFHSHSSRKSSNLDFPRNSLSHRRISGYGHSGSTLGQTRSQYLSIGTDGDNYSTYSWDPSELENLEPENVRDRGIALSLIVMFMDEYNLGNKTVREVVHDFVLPETEDSNMSLAGVMKRYYHDYIGTAGFYVSYPWDANFGRLVKSLSVIDATNGGGNFFWLDIFGLDQHNQMQGSTNEKDQWKHRDECLNIVRQTISEVGRTVAFLDPPINPMIIQRSWCLYECMLTVVDEVELMFCVVPEPPDMNDVNGLLKCLDTTIDAFSPDFENSQTTNPLEKEWLSRGVAAIHPGGARYLNETVGSELLEWLCDRVQDEFSVSPINEQSDIDVCRSLHRLGKLCEDLQRVQDSETNFLALLAVLDAKNSTENDIVLLRASVRHDLACLWGKYFDRLDESEAMFREVLQVRKELLDDSDSMITDTTFALARLLQARKKFDEAEELFRDALKRELESKGSKHRDTLVTVNCLALLLQKRNQLTSAKTLFEKALQAGLETLGSKHPDVLVWSNNLAVLYQDLKRYNKAERLFRRTLTYSEQELGPTHQHTMNIVYNLGQCLWQMGKLRLAETMFRRELKWCEELFGETDRNTKRSRKNLTKLLKALKRPLEPKSLARQSSDSSMSSSLTDDKSLVKKFSSSSLDSATRHRSNQTNEKEELPTMEKITSITEQINLEEQ